MVHKAEGDFEDLGVSPWRWEWAIATLRSREYESTTMMQEQDGSYPSISLAPSLCPRRRARSRLGRLPEYGN